MADTRVRTSKEASLAKTKKRSDIIFYIILIILALIFVFPLLVILMNSFKSKLYISDDLFAFLNQENFVGWTNYITGFTKMNFWGAFSTSLFITVGGTALILVCCSMCGWYLARVKGKGTTFLYYLFVSALVVPFQMVMFTMSWLANNLKLDTPWGILVMYLGFGAGQAVFMFTGFVKGVPIDVEEAANIDGCGPLQTFFRISLPLMKPMTITIAILEVMWIWNDYLLPLIVLKSEYTTLPISIQKIFTGGYGSSDMGGLMAMLVLSILPVVIFYLFSQKYIIQGVVAGAVKG